MSFTDLPDGCPPGDAHQTDAEVYRLVASIPPTPADFESHYDRFPERQPWDDECMARGLSVFVTYEAAQRYRKRYKSLRSNKIAVGTLTPQLGVIKQTTLTVDHHTWWPALPSVPPPTFALHAAETL